MPFLSQHRVAGLILAEVKYLYSTVLNLSLIYSQAPAGYENKVLVLQRRTQQLHDDLQALAEELRGLRNRNIP